MATCINTYTFIVGSNISYTDIHPPRWLWCISVLEAILAISKQNWEANAKQAYVEHIRDCLHIYNTLFRFYLNFIERGFRIHNPYLQRQ